MLGAPLFLLLALGPSLRVNGYETGIWLPYSALTELPFFHGARAPARIALVGMLCLAVWAGYGLQRLLAYGGRFKGLPVLVAALSLVGFVALEYITPLTVSRVRIPNAIQLILPDQKPGVLSFTPMWPSRTAMYQPLHRRKMLMANLGRPDYAVQQYYWRHPALRFLTMPQWADDVPQHRGANYAADLLGLRYIILDHSRYSQAQIPILVSALRDRYDAQSIFADSASTVLLRDRPVWQPGTLHVDVGSADADLHLAYGWSNRSLYEAQHAAWLIRQPGKIALPAALDRGYKLRLRLQVVSQKDVGIVVSVGSEEVDEFDLAPGIGWVQVSIPAQILSQEQTNVVSLRSSVATGLPHQTGLAPPRLQLPVAIEVRSGGMWTSGYGMHPDENRRADVDAS